MNGDKVPIPSREISWLLLYLYHFPQVSKTQRQSICFLKWGFDLKLEITEILKCCSPSQHSVIINKFFFSMWKNFSHFSSASGNSMCTHGTLIKCVRFFIRTWKEKAKLKSIFASCKKILLQYPALGALTCPNMCAYVIAIETKILGTIVIYLRPWLALEK